MTVKNPIDEKFDKATEVLTTSKTVLKSTNFILVISMLTGIGFVIFCLAALVSVREDQRLEVLGYLSISIIATSIVIFLYSKNRKKLKQLLEK